MTKEKRDPYLPPPIVVDFLVSLDWDERTDGLIIQTTEHKKTHCVPMVGCTFAIGRDEYGEIWMPESALDLLKQDAAMRAAND